MTFADPLASLIDAHKVSCCSRLILAPCFPTHVFVETPMQRIAPRFEISPRADA